MAKKEEKLKEETKDAAETATSQAIEEIDAEEQAVSEIEESQEPVSESGSEQVSELEVEADSSPEIELDKTVTVQPIKFTSFEDLSQAQGEINKNLEILMDIKLQLTVELGRTELPIKKVLELTRGSIIELEKVAGEPVELYANGKLVAHGEVVVIEDNFGLRITSITEPEDRLKGL